MVVELTADSSNVRNGFSSSFTCAAASCDGAHSFTTTQLDTPTTVATNGYANNDDCVYTLSCPAGSTVQLSFTSIDTESNFDYVNVFDGDSTSATRLEHEDGTEGSLYVVGSGTTMVVELTADSSNVRSGFSAVFSSGTAPPVSGNFAPCQGRPDEGDTLLVVAVAGTDLGSCVEQHRGSTGSLIQDDASGFPFQVHFGNDDTCWFHEDEVWCESQ